MKKLTTLLIVLVLSVALAGCGLGKDEVTDDKADKKTEQTAKEGNGISDKLPVVVYFADEKDKTLKKEVRYIAKEDGGKTVDYIAKLIMSELLKGPGKDSGVGRVIPEKVSLKDLKVNSSNATVVVTLSKEFADGIKGGKQMEKLAVMSIVNTLTELKEIERVKLMLENNPNGVMTGGQKLGKSFKRNTKYVASANAASSGIVDE